MDIALEDGSSAVEKHRLDIERFPAIRALLEANHARAFTEHDHSDGDGDAFDGVLDLPHGHSCMVVPLFAGDRTLGALTFDRTRCVPYEPALVDLATVYGQIISLALSAA